MNEALARLHAIDVAAVGLADYGKPGNYFARQWQRWSEQYRASETSEIVEMNRLIDWLGREYAARRRARRARSRRLSASTI